MSAPVSAGPAEDHQRQSTFLQKIERIVEDHGKQLNRLSILDALVPRVETLAKAYVDLSADYRQLKDAQDKQAQALAQLAANSSIIASSTRETAEHIGVLMAHVSRADGRMDAIERGQRAAIDATEKELTDIRKASAENRNKLIELTRDDPKIKTPDEITAIRKLPISTAFESQIAAVAVDDFKAKAEHERTRLKQNAALRGKVFTYTAKGLSVVIAAAAIWIAAHYFGVQAGRQETMEERDQQGSKR